MKQPQTRAARGRPTLPNTAAAPCPAGKTQRTTFLNSTKHIFKKRGRPARKAPASSPKLTHQQCTSTSNNDLQAQTLPILQSQQCEGQIQFPKALESTLARPEAQPLAAAAQEGAGGIGEVGVYLASISEHLFRQESRSPPPLFLYSGRFDHQARITHLHLIFNFANRYGFKVETIFLAFALYHRVAFAPELAHHSLALQAVATLFVAAKYEEIAIPKVEVFARCDPRIAPADVLKLESEILLHLNFNLSFPNALQFIDLLRVRYGLDRAVRDKLIGICYKSLNSLALWQERGSLLAMACLHLLHPELELGQSRSQELQDELKWRVAELLRVGVAAGVALV